MTKLAKCGFSITSNINRAFGNREPWQIATITASTVLGLVWLWNLVNHDETIYKRSKTEFFRLLKKLPYVKAKVELETKKVNEGFKNDVIKNINGLEYCLELQKKSMSNEEILKKVDEHLNLGHYEWKNGKVSGAVYYYKPELIELVTQVYGKASYTNPLHVDVFPGVCKMEAEIVRITANLFNGGPKSCGTMTSGGTESIIMACKAYRDYGRTNKGIIKPNIVAPTTVHAAVDKGAKYLGIHVNSVRVDASTTEVDIRAMEAAINKNTIMLVGSAPNFPYGTMDNIEAIANLGKKYKIPVHVDACLGGFVIIFMRKAGFNLRQFDFTIDGVTSISADTHKYGFAPKGSSVILYSDIEYLHSQYTVTTEWPGGVYGSPTVNGSRAGGIIAACWATLMSFGEEGYIEATKMIIDTARYIEKELRKIKGIYVFGKPATSVVAIGSNEFDIFRLSDALCQLGWNLNALQFPSGIHICVTHMHTQNGIAKKFIQEVKNCTEIILQQPGEKVEGKMAIYGVAQSVPDRSLIGDFTRCFLDSAYYTPIIKN